MIQTKDLTVNGKVMARYQISGNDLWIRPMFVFIGPKIDLDAVCGFYAILISEVEKVQIKRWGPLLDPNNDPKKHN